MKNNYFGKTLFLGFSFFFRLHFKRSVKVIVTI